MHHIKDLQEQDKVKLKDAGIEIEGKKNTFFLFNNETDIEEKKKDPGVLLLPIEQALKDFPWIYEKYWWKLVDKDKDEFTKAAFENYDGGYFIHVKKGHKEYLPFQACFYIKESYYKQKVHNIIILEEDSELHILNGCISATESNQAQHLGITEIFIGKNAFLSYSMIHNWNETTEVFPRSAARVEENGQYISNYIALKATKIVQTNPTVYLGKNARTSLNSIIYAHSKSVYDVGGTAILESEGARAEITSRSVTAGGEIIARADIKAKADKTFGHMECSSLMLTDDGKVHAVPELLSTCRDVTLSHEAMVGKIAEEEVHYLMSRGISEAQAVSLIVKGFLSLDTKSLPDMIKAQINEVLEMIQTQNAM